MDKFKMFINQVQFNKNSDIRPAVISTCEAGPSCDFRRSGSEHRAERVLEKFFLVTLHHCFTLVNAEILSTYTTPQCLGCREDKHLSLAGLLRRKNIGKDG